MLFLCAAPDFHEEARKNAREGKLPHCLDGAVWHVEASGPNRKQGHQLGRRSGGVQAEQIDD
jgi:hypothetical protein